MAEITTATATDEIRMRLSTLVREASRMADRVKDAESELMESRKALQSNYDLTDSYVALLKELGETTGVTLWPRVKFEPGVPFEWRG